ncbi:acyl-CoA dehydrogenase family protein [Zhongshania sp.]|jgi:acyl-CoA dehydrogenase|uniref:acyl-CoA dehydrogenase family protein n=1 Tax=Zhongshania sp. TaxID=1971902 RepID=UPI002A807B00|nr:acyl-CoA dehydrogenase family protein [Zhongshania sp.]
MFDHDSKIKSLLDELDAFIADEIRPLESGDNARFFDQRREYSRTDWENDGLPADDWTNLLTEARERAVKAGLYYFALPVEFGGRDGTNFEMAVIREYLAKKGLGLHCDLHSEHCIVGNNPMALVIRDFGSEQQKNEFLRKIVSGEYGISFGLTEPLHGSDATWMETKAVPEVRGGVRGWRIDGEKMWTTGAYHASHVAVFARTSGADGDALGISCFLVPSGTEGLRVEERIWTFNMPADEPRISLIGLWVPDTARLGDEGRGLACAQHFVHENRIRQAASSIGTAGYCIAESVSYANTRVVFGRPLSRNQAIQFPLSELHTDYTLLKNMVFSVSKQIDEMSKKEVSDKISDVISMCNYRANKLACDAADRAIQVHGAIGYSRQKQFEHHYRHHRRYRITEGSDEIQLRKIAGHLFKFIK